MERLTEVNWKNLDPWETCGQGMYYTRNCHEEGGCANGCPVPRLYRKLAEYEDLRLSPDEIRENANAFANDRAYFFEEKEKLEKERNYWEIEAKKGVENEQVNKAH